MTPTEKKAIALLKTTDQSMTAIAKAVGMSPQTISRWAKKYGVERTIPKNLVAAIEARDERILARRSHLRERMIDEAHALLDRINEPHIEFMSAGAMGPQRVVYESARSGDIKNYVTSVAILVDKLRLESGEANERKDIEITVAQAQSVLEAEVINIRREIDRRAG